MRYSFYTLLKRTSSISILLIPLLEVYRPLDNTFFTRVKPIPVGVTSISTSWPTLGVDGEWLIFWNLVNGLERHRVSQQVFHRRYYGDQDERETKVVLYPRGRRRKLELTRTYWRDWSSRVIFTTIHWRFWYSFFGKPKTDRDRTSWTKTSGLGGTTLWVYGTTTVRLSVHLSDIPPPLRGPWGRRQTNVDILSTSLLSAFLTLYYFT